MLLPWVWMWILAVAIYAACKWVTWQGAALKNVPASKHLAYLVAWPGLDARAFLRNTAPPRCLAKEWFAATAKLVLGAVLLFGVARTIPPKHTCIVGWIGMIGIVLILHFGFFHLLSCFWRCFGIDARPLMNRPLASTSLSEFWGRRWNTAFRDLTHRYLFRPCTSRFGPRWGLFAGFLFSGVVHDLVISVPARGGYGGPTVFFAIQGAALVFERSSTGRRIGLGAGWTGRAFAILILASPVFLLFHRPFVVGIILPFMHAVRAL
jgi:D-alanyl-lipoteichoic acid acyltransferase DltB (MBOAT superfamily)